MQRVRMSLPYFQSFGWEAEVVIVGEQYIDIVQDELLLQSIPINTIIHDVAALPKKWTQKLGLGSIALRSLYYYLKKVNKLLSSKKFDLIYFSTTQFPICILGNYWKRKFNVPYIIDMQDPWHSDYYKDKPKSQRPPKYWFSYNLNKFLEPIAMKHVDALISVSQAYIETLQGRYPHLTKIPNKVITFGAFDVDFDIAKTVPPSKNRILSSDTFNIVYIGRGGQDMKDAISLLFDAFKKGLSIQKDFSKIRFYFIGTSYAAAGFGKKTIAPIAELFGINDFVVEQTDRIPFYQSLSTIQSADILFIPGSNDAQYTASKLYPYIMAKKPIIALFNEKSSAVKILNDCLPSACVLTFQQEQNTVIETIIIYIQEVMLENKIPVEINHMAFNNFTAKSMVEKQVNLFNEVVL